MGGFSQMLNLQLMLFCLIGLGVLFAKLHVLEDKVQAGLSELVISLVLPCNIVAAFMVEWDLSVLFSLGSALGIGLGIQLFSLLLAKTLYRRVQHGKRMVLQYSTIISNAGFMGNPVAQGLYGEAGLLYGTAYLVPMRIFMWTAGISCFTTSTGRAAVKKLLCHPCIIATVVGFVLMLTGWRPPGFIEGTIRTIGGCNTALSMLVIGGILAKVPLRSIFSKLSLAYCGVRLVLIPLAVLGVLLLVRPAAIVLKVSVVLAAMPAPGTTALLAAKYGGDSAFASRLIFLSTLLSMVSLPLLATLLEHIV